MNKPGGMIPGASLNTAIQFYVPASEFPDGAVPDSLDAYWPWAAKHTSVGEIGRITWTLKTFLYLKEHQVPAALVTTFPSSGIVASHRDYLPLHLRPRPDVFLVCIKPDRKEHTWAQFYIVQNEQDRIFSGRLADRARYVMHWPQPHLRPRDQRRGPRCENVGYFGRPVNLAPELAADDWATDLAELGFQWRVVPSTEWHDYGTIDVTVSVRAFEQATGDRDPLLDPHSKPPSKLINSWAAGVPAIVGRESAYRNLRRTTLDYLEAGSPPELIAGLQRLRTDRGLYNAMVANGLERARAFSAQAVCEQWQRLIELDIIPAYRAWMRRGRLARLYATAHRLASFASTPGNLTGFRMYRDRSTA
jgi:hypothetical protein